MNNFNPLTSEEQTILQKVLKHTLSKKSLPLSSKSVDWNSIKSSYIEDMEKKFTVCILDVAGDLTAGASKRMTAYAHTRSGRFLKPDNVNETIGKHLALKRAYENYLYM